MLGTSLRPTVGTPVNRTPIRASIAVAVVAASLALVLGGCASASTAGSNGATSSSGARTRILSGTVLLTDDDGWSAPGLQALKKALVDDGHKVVVVAPLGNESGTGASVTTTGTLSVSTPNSDRKVFAVDGTPADSVMLGLTGIGLAKPSLVISGINPGYNVGDDLNYSGTVGAAVAATLYGIPSIAVSMGGTDDASMAAAFVVKFVDKLDSAAASTWPKGSVLNLNYPAPGAKSPSSVELTSVADKRSMRAIYTHTAGDSYALSYVPDTKTAKGTDIAAVAANTVSVSAFPANRGATKPSYAKLRSFVATITP